MRNLDIVDSAERIGGLGGLFRSQVLLKTPPERPVLSTAPFQDKT